MASVMRPPRPALVALVCIISVATLFAADASAPEYHLRNMHTHPWFWDVLAASFVGWMIGRVKGFSTSKDWLEKYWPDPPKIAVFLVDVAIFVGVGAYFGTGIYLPTSFLSALAAGLSWPVGLGALATKE